MNPVVFVLEVFLGCTAIGSIAIIAGTGGGVLFTTLFLGFTAIHPDIVRAAGLLAALAGTRMGGRRFLKVGLANIRLVLVLGVFYTVFAVLGAIVGLDFTRRFGEAGVGILKLALGIIVMSVGLVYLLTKGVDYPRVRSVDRFTRWLGLGMSYYEGSRQAVVDYRVTRAGAGMILICVVGFISGSFGLGGGWAITPLLNLMMMAPLKVAVASSAVMISMGDTAAIFPYLLSNSVVPVFAIPAVLGLIVGAEIGSRIALRVRPKYIRYILIVIMLGTGLQLIHKGLAVLGGM